jgi:hypothetical protein
MIHYALRCADGHEFDGWFKSSASFDHQAKSGLLDCPVCASTMIERALMAPRIAGRAIAAPQTDPAPTASANARPEPADTGQPAARPDATPPRAPAPTMPQAMPDEMRVALQRIRAEIERKCDYVGPHFAREVRLMAEKREPHRPIYGEATADEAEALAEDGIEIARIPWVPRADS